MNNLINDTHLKSDRANKTQEFKQYFPEIARWYNNLECAISLRFDDNDKSHVNFVIPLLNNYGFKGTFMVNPGRNYKRHKSFWENEVTGMGHKFGNHTWHHKGAKSVEDAEYEIGEVSKLIWTLYPQDTKLNVFASGGGELWGGKRWHRSSPQFKAIPEKYYLIDLYDGKHPGIELNSDSSKEIVERIINKAIEDKIHQAFIFHKIGNKSLKDYLRIIVSNFNYTYGEKQFSEMMQYLNTKRGYIWIAPIIDIIKYETEFRSSELIILSDNTDEIIVKLKINTDPELYDQELSLIIPTKNHHYPQSILQGGNLTQVKKLSGEKFVGNIKPHESDILIQYN